MKDQSVVTAHSISNAITLFVAIAQRLAGSDMAPNLGSRDVKAEMNNLAGTLFTSKLPDIVGKGK